MFPLGGFSLADHDWMALGGDPNAKSQLDLISSLSHAQGSGLLTLIVPPNKTISDTLTALSNERALVSSANVRLNQSRSISPFVMAQNRVRDYYRIPPNGLVIFAGKIAAGTPDDGERETREKLIYAEFEPFIPLDFLTRVVCISDRTFHVAALSELKGPSPDPSAMEAPPRMIRIDPQISGARMPMVVVRKETRQRARMCGACNLYGKSVCHADIVYLPNIGDIADALNRNPQHLTNFLCQKLLCNEGSYDFIHRRAILDNDSISLTVRHVQGAIYAFINKFVLCTGSAMSRSALVAAAILLPLMAAAPFFNKFRHWPMSANGTCGDDGPGTLTCPPGYQCYVGPIYNRPFFCFHEDVDPNDDPYEVLERVRANAADEAKKSGPLDELHLNNTEETLRQLLEEVRGMGRGMPSEKSVLDWALAIAPTALILVTATVGLLFHLQQRTIHARTRRLVREAGRETAARIESLAEACFMSTPSPPRNLVARRQGQPTNEDPRSLIFNSGRRSSGGAQATASTSGAGVGGVRPPPRFPSQIITRFNDALAQHQQVTTVEIHHEETDDDLPPPPPPLSIQNETNFTTERQQRPRNEAFPLQEEEERQRPDASAFMSTTSLYEDATNRKEWGEGRSLLQRGNSMGRLPPRRPAPPSIIPTLNQQARLMGGGTGAFINRPSTSQQTLQTPMEMRTFGGGTSTSNTTTNRGQMPSGRGAKPPPPDFSSQSYV